MSEDDRRNGNGRDMPVGLVTPLLTPLPPPRPRLREVDAPSRTATTLERAMAYGDALAGYNKHLPTIYGELDEMRAAINSLPARLVEAIRVTVRDAIGDERRALREELQREVRAVQESVPDPDEVEEAARRGAAAGVAEATGPHRSITPTKIRAVTEQVLDERDGKAAREKLHSIEVERSDGKKDWRRLAFQIAGGIALGVAGFVGAGLYGACQREAGRMVGVSEGRAASPIVTVPVPVNVGEPEVASPPAASAPAAVAPGAPPSRRTR